MRSRLSWLVRCIAGVAVLLGTLALATPPASALPPFAASLKIDPWLIPADGRTTTTAVLTVTDALGRPVRNANVAFATDGDASLGGVKNNGDGTYTSVITASLTDGFELITATAKRLALKASAQEYIVEEPWSGSHLTPASLTLRAEPEQVEADGQSTFNVVATVLDAEGRGVRGRFLNFQADSAVGEPFGLIKDNGDGTYTSTWRSGTHPNQYWIRGSVEGTGLTADTSVRLVANRARTMTMTLSPQSVPADGTSLVEALVRVADEAGQPVNAGFVEFSHDGDLYFTGWGPTGEPGEYVAQLQASRTPGLTTIRARAEYADNLTASAVLEETSTSPVAGASLVLDPATVPADGQSQSLAIARFVDAEGDGHSGLPVQFATDGDVRLGPVQDHGDGTYSSLVTASTTSGVEQITVTDPTSGVSAWAHLTEQPAGVARVAVAVEPGTITADGTSTATVTARTVNHEGEPVAGDPVTRIWTSGDVVIGAVTDHGNGVFTAPLTASTTAGYETITAITEGGRFGDAYVMERAGPPTSVRLDLWTSRVRADGQDQGHFSVWGFDQYGNSTPEPPVSVASDGDITIDSLEFDGGSYWGTFTSSTTPGVETLTATLLTNGATSSAQVTEVPPGGYWMAAADGGVFAFGQARFFGSTGGMQLPAPIVDIANTPNGGGYWMVGEDGAVYAFGNAADHGDVPAASLRAPVVSLAPTPTGGGYWIMSSDGSVFPFGDAADHGSMRGIQLRAPMVDMAVTAAGDGYWLVDAEGGIYAFDAPYHGSAGNVGQDVVGIARSAGGAGYWLAEADGTVYSFGDAAVVESVDPAGEHEVVGVGRDDRTGGLYLLDSNNDVHALAGAWHYGDLGGWQLAQPLTALSGF